MKNKRILFMTQAAMIAAIYVVLTVLGAAFSFGEFQIRVAEALTILPAFTPAAVPGLLIGCLIGNLLGGAILPDIILGSLATLLGAVGTYLLRKQHPLLAALPPILSNILIVPLILRYAYGYPLPIPWLMFTIGVGEFLSCGILGWIVYRALARHRHYIFKQI